MKREESENLVNILKELQALREVFIQLVPLLEKIAERGATTQAHESDREDELYDEARKIVIQAGKASTSYLQRRLGIGYARAARLIDMLEEKGVIGPATGSLPRRIVSPKRLAPEVLETLAKIEKQIQKKKK
jgi:DNA segregation ATPase FtsK/SpoIIIE, S-DNA-T family